MKAGGCVVELDTYAPSAARPWLEPEPAVEPWRTGPRDRVAQATELIVVLRRGSLDARRLAAAIERTKAPDALARGDLAVFQREVARAAAGLWRDRELPYQLAWALDAIGVVQRDRPLGLTG